MEQLHQASYGWALSCCSHDPAEAEDVLQTVYLKILEGRARYKGKAAFKTWLFSVIRKTAADSRRAKRLRRLGFLRFKGISVQAAPARSVERDQTVSDTRDLLQKALAELPRRQREVLLLTYYSDLSLEEAAKVMGLSIGSTRTHYHRGKKKLREWLERQEVRDASGIR